jgi:hypothetical protein
MKASMRHLGLVSGFALLSLLGFSTSTKAQTATDIVVTINSNCVLSGIDSNKTINGITSLPSGAQPLGNPTVNCNAANGFKLKAKALRSQGLSNGATTPTFVPYTYTINGSSFSLTATDTDVVTRPFDATCASSAGCIFPASFTITTPTTGVPAGTYTDTITYTLAAQ